MPKKADPSLKERVAKLRAEINRLREAYHVRNEPGVTDDVYDSLTRELKAILKEHPELEDPSSSLLRVAGKPLEKFQKVQHKVRMLSLNDVFSVEELYEWGKRVEKLLGRNAKPSYFSEVKFDGLAISLIYEKGRFAR